AAPCPAAPGLAAAAGGGDPAFFTTRMLPNSASVASARGEGELVNPPTRIRFVIVAASETTGGARANRPHPAQQATAQGTAELGTPAPLNRTERQQLDVVRRFGTTGSLVLAFGAIGAGAAPVDNPLSGVRLLGLPVRIPTVAMACAWLGMMMLVISWLWLGKLSWPGKERMVSVTQLARTVVMWALPLALAPPLFSTDVYSYLAQSEVAARGYNPYELGPVNALGVEHPFTSNVPNTGRAAPPPCGPLPLMIGQPLSRVIGDNVVFGVLLWRVVMLCGFAMAIWAIPRLARRCGVQPVAALWLSAANPVALFHVVSGMHNEAIMVGIMRSEERRVGKECRSRGEPHHEEKDYESKHIRATDNRLS